MPGRRVQSATSATRAKVRSFASATAAPLVRSSSATACRQWPQRRMSRSARRWHAGRSGWWASTAKAWCLPWIRARAARISSSGRSAASRSRRSSRATGWWRWSRSYGPAPTARRALSTARSTRCSRRCWRLRPTRTAPAYSQCLPRQSSRRRVRRPRGSSWTTRWCRPLLQAHSPSLTTSRPALLRTARVGSPVSSSASPPKSSATPTWCCQWRKRRARPQRGRSPPLYSSA
mmetsp:Transcript_20679/g.49141  ORF Transcript_20679/g.49141 Transcript_20679/m.49141 type:complete len:233 (-) Transcript_20679:109-807(-)